ncbi:selenium-dependent molybdenum hydroxylase 1 [Desulfocapsa sulfexigens DSM 10523]|uniref:Selenium-dependent molybdenum hydroxylase 1 n=1 Tax=Desulfocapsa sulfexigens (strain DSM 10523 / SB164P1) TaxID=1167006 RepID=M1PDS9_DESSD|nr:selenium-dependent xanthine dehydrogenase [Desulfocapsa sulfexigens]AGF77870.1 selenium-dependent molybdenum hydroxylase 1 [Desulfocapsa sulfexigens DSM 10523]
MIELTLNGEAVQYTGDEDVSLLSWLRSDLNLTAAKDGCSGQAACGACLVEVDEKAVLACATPMKNVAGKNVVTLEGLPESLLQTLGRAFVAKGAVQCGFCTPGFLTRTKILLQKNSNPSRAEVEKELRFNLCRCTGYVKIVDAVLAAATAMAEQKDTPFEERPGIGVSSPKFKAVERAIGRKPFVDDLRFEGMLHGALKFSEHPRARILSIDISEAEKQEGVRRVLLAADIPGQRNSGLIVEDWPLMLEVGEVTRYIGDVLASVVADTEVQARAAVQKIRVEYEVLEALTDMHQALTSPIKVHESGNLLGEKIIRRGDSAGLLQRSAHVARGTFTTQTVDHGFLEVECCVVIPQDDGIKVFSQSQGPYRERDEIAHQLALPESQVEVEVVDCGGAFGGKEDMTVQGHAALACHLLRRPVKYKLTRPESIRMHPKRHPTSMEYEIGCDDKGMLTGLYARILGDTGAYASVGGPVMDRAGTHASGGYHFEAVDIEARSVYTNNIPCGAMRGFGVNQATFALESLIDELCLKGGFDRWQFRYDNALDIGRMLAPGQVLTASVGLRETLLSVKDAYDRAEYKGLACAVKNCGVGNGIPELSRVFIEIHEGGKIILHHGWTEMGQGVHTIARQALCEATGITDIDLVTPYVSTASGAIGGPTTASRGTLLLGRAIIDAAKGLKEDLKTQSLKQLAGKTYSGEFLCDYTQADGKPGEIISHISYGYATNLAILDGDGNLEKIIASHDAGRILNPKLFQGQIEGGVAMGVGYALSETVPLQDGRLTSEKYRALGIPKINNLPEIEVIGVESNDPEGPFGAKGVGEIGCIATAPAIANAFCDYDGKRRYSLPLEPIKKK